MLFKKVLTLLITKIKTILMPVIIRVASVVKCDSDKDLEDEKVDSGIKEMRWEMWRTESIREGKELGERSGII